MFHKKKNSRYTPLQKRLIFNEYNSKKSIREISHSYNASASSIYNIVKCTLMSKNYGGEPYSNDSLSNKLNYEEKQLIKELVKPPQKPLTIDIINNEITKSFGAKNRKRDIKSYLKKSLNYSYKKGGATTFKGATERALYFQSIFSSKILCEIMNNKLIINIDEWVF